MNDFNNLDLTVIKSNTAIKTALEKLPVSMSGLNIRSINVLNKLGIDNLYDAIIEIKTGYKSSKGVGKKSIEESIDVIDEILSKLSSLDIKPDTPIDFDFRLLLFGGLGFDLKTREDLESFPVSMLGFSNRVQNSLVKNGITNVYESIIEIKTGFSSTKEGLGKKSINESVQIIDKLLANLKNIDPDSIEDVIDSRIVYFKDAHGEFLSVFSQIIDLYFDKVVKKHKQRNHDILIKRFNLDNKGQYTLEDIGTYYSLTRERVRQIENKILLDLEKLLLGESIYSEWRLDKKVHIKFLALKNILHSKEIILLNSEVEELFSQNISGQYNSLYTIINGALWYSTSLNEYKLTI